MAKQNANLTYHWCFLEKHVESCICQWFKFFAPIYFLQRYLIQIADIRNVVDSHLIKSLWSKKKKAILNLKDTDYLKLQS